MTRKHRRAILAAALALVMLFSVLYIALEAGHDCHGEDCAVCAQISACMDLLRLMALSLLAIAAAAVLRAISTQFREALFIACQSTSLITLKVKLSD